MSRQPTPATARFALLAALLLFTTLWLLYPQELPASDPLAYSQRAFVVASSGHLGVGDVFDQRLAVILPTALFYRLLGVNILTTNLAPLISALLIFVSVWLALPDTRSRIVALALCLTSVPLLGWSVALYPDLIAAAFMALSFTLLLRREGLARGPVGVWGLLLPLAAVVALFVAFLAKMSAVWLLPLWGWALVTDLRSSHKWRLIRRFHIPALVIGILLGAGYLLFSDIVWDRPLARVSAIDSLTGQHLWSWDGSDDGALLKRLTIGPLQMLADEYGVPLLVLALLCPLIAPRSIRPWAYYAWTCLALYWFGTTSLSSYQPMPLMGRMTLPILPALLVLSAYLTSRLSIETDHPSRLGPLVPVLFVLALTAIPFAGHLYVWRWVTLAETRAMSIVQETVEQHPDQIFTVLTSDSRSPVSLPFYFGYRLPANLDIQWIHNESTNLSANERLYVFVNKNRSGFVESAYGDRQYDLEIDRLALPRAFVSGNVLLLEATREAIASLRDPSHDTDDPSLRGR